MNALAPAGAFFCSDPIHFGTKLPDLGNNPSGWNYNDLILKNLLLWHVIRLSLMHHPKPPGFDP